MTISEATDEDIAEWDAMMAEAYEVTYQADLLAMRAMIGVAPLEELQEFLASDPTSSNPYVDLGSLQSACFALGLDASSGQLLPGSA